MPQPRSNPVLPVRAVLGPVLSVALGVVPVAQAQLCDTSSRWEPTFGIDGGPGAIVQALAVYDDGNGAMLYAGGSFISAGPPSTFFLARWNGSDWQALPGGGPGSSVLDLEVYDDGSGPQLYAGGLFSSVGGVSTKAIARYDGAAWSALGTGLAITGLGQEDVCAMTGFDGALAVGGNFNQAGGATAEFTAAWDGTAWTPLGASGPLELFPYVLANDNGALLAGGAFTSPAGFIAELDTTSDTWQPITVSGDPLDGAVWSIVRLPDDGILGGGLVAAGDFTGGIRVLNDAQTGWEPLGGDTDGSVRSLLVFDDGNGPALYAGGLFTEINGTPAAGIAKWDGTAWAPLGAGLTSAQSALGAGALDLAPFDDGLGEALFAGGTFGQAGQPILMDPVSVAQWVPECPPSNSCVTDYTTTSTNPGDPGFGVPDGFVDGADLTYFVEFWLAADISADVTTTSTNPGDAGYGVPDGVVNGNDLTYYVEFWLATTNAPCP